MSYLRKSRPESEGSHYQCVGVGAGPSNLSLACLLESRTEVSSLFFERDSAFSWHDGQLVRNASLQVSVLKDLVTLADPTNPFSFLAYLHSEGKIYHFLNAQFDDVPRREYRNYLEWVSSRLPNLVFGETVESIDFDGHFVVRTNRRTVTADNVVIGVGKEPRLPSVVGAGMDATQFHVSEYVNRARDIGGKRIAVIGGGQSGAEVFLDLVTRSRVETPERVLWVSRRSNFFPLDDSPFTNDFFMPSFSEQFFRWGHETRDEFNTRHVLASDGISASTLRAIYQEIYRSKFVDGSTVGMELYPGRTVVAVKGCDSDGWDLSLANDTAHEPELLSADVVIWATGFAPGRLDFLEPISSTFEREGDTFKVDPDFAVKWNGPADRRVFLQNATLQQRGLADQNLSLVAWRSQRILDRIRGGSSTEQCESFISW